MYVYVLIIIAAYLLGSIPSAVWIGKRFYGIDVREHGSKNAGATNTLRVLGRKAALPVFIIDFLKGFAAVSLSNFIVLIPDSDEMYNLKIALVSVAVLGHIFPIFAKFKGGKGVATLTGAILAVYPPAILLSIAIFIVLLAITHYVSLSSMIGGISFPITSYFLFGQTSTPLLIFGCVVAILLVVTHRKNIKRLIAGEESKIYIIKQNPK